MGGEDEVGRTGRRRASPWRRRPAALLTACALGACTAPAAAQPGELPGWWLAESPGTSGARFGLGLDYLFDDLDSLLNAASTQTVTLVDPRGGRSTQVIPGDPGLNNRKFDYEVEVESWGIQTPIALPRVQLGRRVTLFPSLVTEVATTEVTFDFRDRTVAGDSTSISGRAVSWGLGLEGVAALGRGGSWFLGAGYRFRSLPDVDLERSPALVDVGSDRQPGQLVSFVRDEVALSQDTHVASLRLGRAFAGGRVNPWVGVRGRWTDVEIDDEIGLVSALDDLDGDGVPDFQTDLTTRSRFESDTTLAVAGVDARLGESLVGRAEVGYGDGDVAALLKVVYLFRTPTGPPLTPQEIARRNRRIDASASRVAAAFSLLVEEFLQSAEALELFRHSDPVRYRERALDLVTSTESKAIGVLEREGYFALADWLRGRAEEVRAGLRQSQGRAGTASVRPSSVRVALAAFRVPDNESQEQDDDGDDGLRAFDRYLKRILGLAKERCLYIDVGFEIVGRKKAQIVMHLRGLPNGARYPINSGDHRRIKVGNYSYVIKTRQGELSKCGGEGTLQDCPLNLVDYPAKTVECDFETPNLELCMPGDELYDCSGP